MPMGWTEVTIGGESVKAYVQDTAGPVELHAPAGTKAMPGTPVRIGEARYVVKGSHDPGGREEVTIIELMTEAEAKAAKEAGRPAQAKDKPAAAIQTAAPSRTKKRVVP